MAFLSEPEKHIHHIAMNNRELSAQHVESDISFCFCTCNHHIQYVSVPVIHWLPSLPFPYSNQHTQKLYHWLLLGRNAFLEPSRG